MVVIYTEIVIPSWWDLLDPSSRSNNGVIGLDSGMNLDLLLFVHFHDVPSSSHSAQLIIIIKSPCVEVLVAATSQHMSITTPEIHDSDTFERPLPDKLK